MKRWDIWKRIGLVIPAGVLLACVGRSLGGYQAPVYESLIPNIVQAAESVETDENAKPDGKVETKKDDTTNNTGAVIQTAAANAETTLPPAEETDAIYKDGVYVGTATGFGGKMSVQVTIADGKIVSVKVLDNNETPEFLAQALVLCDQIVLKQSTNVDIVSGATYSSNGIIGGARNALAQALTDQGADTNPELLADDSQSQEESTEKSGSENETKKQSEKKKSNSSDVVYKDGTYTGTGTGFSGKLTVKVKIKNGKITSIKVTKSEDDKSFLDNAKLLIPDIIQKQSTDVDTVSGATYSSNGIIEAVQNALKKAEKKSSKKKTSTKNTTDSKKNNSDSNSENKKTSTSEAEGNFPYKDGTYTGIGEGFNGDVVVAVTIKNKKITKITITENEDDAVFFKRASTITSEVIKQQKADVDIVSGATYSSRGILEAIANALEAAKAATNGNTSDSESNSGNNGTGGDNGSSNNSGGTNTDTENNGGGSQESDGNNDNDEEPVFRLADGTYTGTALCEPDERGGFSAYNLSLNVVIQEGHITEISGISEVGSYSAYNKSYIQKAANGTTRKPGVVNQILAMGYLQSIEMVSQIDTISGATCSSYAIVAACQNALEQAKEAAWKEENTSDSGQQTVESAENTQVDAAVESAENTQNPEIGKQSENTEITEGNEEE